MMNVLNERYMNNLVQEILTKNAHTLYKSPTSGVFKEGKWI